MKRAPILTRLVAGSLLALPASAYGGDAPRPNATAAPAETFAGLLAGSHEAMGGRLALDAIRSIAARADCTGPNGAYTTEVLSARGGRVVFKQVTSAGREFAGMANGRYAWTRDAATNAVDPASPTVASMIRGHEFQMIPIELATRYSEPVVEGTEPFAGRPCVAVRAVDDLGRPCRLFFDPASRLFAGMVIEDPRGVEGRTVRVVVDAWREVDGVKLPSRVTATDSTGDFVLDFKEIRLNTVDEAVFNVPDRVVWIAELLEIHDEQRRVHFERDAKGFADLLADGYLNVDRGGVDRPEREATIARFQAYFDRSTFLEWDDISPPIIRVSDDGTMGYVVVHKRVRLRARNEQGIEEESETVFSWIATFERRDGAWKVTAVASTRAPSSE